MGWYLDMSTDIQIPLYESLHSFLLSPFSILFLSLLPAALTSGLPSSLDYYWETNKSISVLSVGSVYQEERFVPG